MLDKSRKWLLRVLKRFPLQTNSFFIFCLLFLFCLVYYYRIKVNVMCWLYLIKVHQRPLTIPTALLLGLWGVST